MAIFREVADKFVAEPKRAVGMIEWKTHNYGNGVGGFWLLEMQSDISAHRLFVIEFYGNAERTYSVMVQIEWLGRHIPIARLNVGSDQHTHHNRGDRPFGVPASASGNRIYLWEKNRLAFRPETTDGLPFAQPLSPSPLSLPGAIQTLAQSVNIDVDSVHLPTAAARFTLF